MTGPTGYTYVNGDVPLVSDPFGEGLNRCMIYRPSNDTWFIKNIGCWNAPTTTGGTGSVTWNSVIYVKVSTTTLTTGTMPPFTTTVLSPSVGNVIANPDGTRTTIPTTSNTSTTANANTANTATTTTNISVTHYTSSDVYVASFSGGGDADSVPFVGDIFGKFLFVLSLVVFLCTVLCNKINTRLCVTIVPF